MVPVNPPNNPKGWNSDLPCKAKEGGPGKVEGSGPVTKPVTPQKPQAQNTQPTLL